MRVGIIGRGKLGGAIADGLARSDTLESIATTTRGSQRNNAHVASESDVIILCVKPPDLKVAIDSILPAISPAKVLVSTAASVGVEDLREMTGERIDVIRAMPNTAARQAQAMTVFGRDARTCDRSLAAARGVFEIVGRTMIVEERLMDAVTGVSGCGPAFAFVVMEAMIDGAIALGVPYERARELVAQTMLGSAALVLASSDHPAVLKAAVATPGGRTVRGLAELEDRNVRAALSRAVRAAGQHAWP